MATTKSEVVGAVELAPTAAPSTNGDAPAELVYDFTIAGKAVHLKRRVPLREGRMVSALLKHAQETGDLLDQVPVACLMIESWEFPGDPSTPVAYDDLDTFGEFLPLMNRLAEHITAQSGQANSKNGASAPS